MGVELEVDCEENLIKEDKKRAFNFERSLWLRLIFCKHLFIGLSPKMIFCGDANRSGEIETDI